MNKLYIFVAMLRYIFHLYSVMSVVFYAVQLAKKKKKNNFWVPTVPVDTAAGRLVRKNETKLSISLQWS